MWFEFQNEKTYTFQKQRDEIKSKSGSNKMTKRVERNEKVGAWHRNVYLKSSLREREGSSFDSTSRNEPFIFQDVNTGLRAGNFSQWLEEKGRLLTSRGRRREIRGKRRTSWTLLFRKNNFQQVLTSRAINLWDEYSVEYSYAYVATRLADIYLNTRASEISEMSQIKLSIISIIFD